MRSVHRMPRRAPGAPWNRNAVALFALVACTDADSSGDRQVDSGEADPGGGGVETGASAGGTGGDGGSGGTGGDAGQEAWYDGLCAFELDLPAPLGSLSCSADASTFVVADGGLTGEAACGELGSTEGPHIGVQWWGTLDTAGQVTGDVSVLHQMHGSTDYYYSTPPLGGSVADGRLSLSFSGSGWGYDDQATAVWTDGRIDGALRE